MNEKNKKQMELSGRRIKLAYALRDLGWDDEQVALRLKTTPEVIKNYCPRLGCGSETQDRYKEQ